MDNNSNAFNLLQDLENTANAIVKDNDVFNKEAQGIKPWRWWLVGAYLLPLITATFATFCALILLPTKHPVIIEFVVGIVTITYCLYRYFKHPERKEFNQQQQDRKIKIENDIARWESGLQQLSDNYVSFSQVQGFAAIYEQLKKRNGLEIQPIKNAEQIAKKEGIQQGCQLFGCLFAIVTIPLALLGISFNNAGKAIKYN